ncbi:MAG: MarR family transcriptional regulator [Bacteroidota bacterium]
METSVIASSFRHIISGLSKRLRKTVSSVDNLSLSEFSTLSYLYHEQALSATELAKLIMVKLQSMSELLIRLQGLGIIEKTPSDVDKRKSLISLTDKGRQIVEHTRYERDEWLTQAIDGTLSETDKKTLQDALAVMTKVMDFKQTL